MGGMEFQALRARNTPAYINLSHNDPVVALTDNILRTWAVCRPGDEKRGDKKRARYSPILIAEVNVRVGVTIDGGSVKCKVRGLLENLRTAARSRSNQDRIE